MTKTKTITKLLVTLIWAKQLRECDCESWRRSSERGVFLSLILGSAKFYVLLIDFKTNEEPDITTKIYAISNDHMTGPGSQVPPNCLVCPVVPL